GMERGIGSPLQSAGGGLGERGAYATSVSLAGAEALRLRLRRRRQRRLAIVTDRDVRRPAPLVERQLADRRAHAAEVVRVHLRGADVANRLAVDDGAAAVRDLAGVAEQILLLRRVHPRLLPRRLRSDFVAGGD